MWNCFGNNCTFFAYHKKKKRQTYFASAHPHKHVIFRQLLFWRGTSHRVALETSHCLCVGCFCGDAAPKLKNWAAGSENAVFARHAYGGRAVPATRKSRTVRKGEQQAANGHPGKRLPASENITPQRNTSPRLYVHVGRTVCPQLRVNVLLSNAGIGRETDKTCGWEQQPQLGRVMPRISSRNSTLTFGPENFSTYLKWQDEWRVCTREQTPMQSLTPHWWEWRQCWAELNDSGAAGQGDICLAVTWRPFPTPHFQVSPCWWASQLDKPQSKGPLSAAGGNVCDWFLSKQTNRWLLAYTCVCSRLGPARVVLKKFKECSGETDLPQW